MKDTENLGLGGSEFKLEIKADWWGGLFDGEPIRWNSDQIRLVLLGLCDKYLDMSEEDLSDVTPFDVLNDVNKLI